MTMAPAILPPELLLRIFELTLDLELHDHHHHHALSLPASSRRPSSPAPLLKQHQHQQYDDENDNNGGNSSSSASLAHAHARRSAQARCLARTCSIARRAALPVLYERVCLALPARAVAFAQGLHLHQLGRSGTERASEGAAAQEEDEEVRDEQSALRHVKYAFLGKRAWWRALDTEEQGDRPDAARIRSSSRGGGRDAHAETYPGPWQLPDDHDARQRQQFMRQTQAGSASAPMQLNGMQPDEDEAMRIFDAMQLSAAGSASTSQPAAEPAGSSSAGVKQASDRQRRTSRAGVPLVVQLGLDPLACAQHQPDRAIEHLRSLSPSSRTNGTQTALPPTVYRHTYPPATLPRIEELAFLTTEELVGGFLLGHHISFRPAGEWSRLPAPYVRRAAAKVRARARSHGAAAAGGGGRGGDARGGRGAGRTRVGNSYDPSADGVVLGPDGYGAAIEDEELDMDDLAHSPSAVNRDATGPPDSDTASAQPLPYSYSLITPAVTGSLVALLAHMPTLVRLTLTIYPGAVVDNDELEHVLRLLLSRATLPLLRRLTVCIAHDRLSIGSRIRRIDRSRTVQGAAERVCAADPLANRHRIRVRTASREFATRPEEVMHDVESFIRADWEQRCARRAAQRAFEEDEEQDDYDWA